MFEFIKRALSKNGSPSSMRLFNAWTMGFGIPTICFSVIWLTVFYKGESVMIGSLAVLAGLIGTVLKFKKDQVKDEKKEENVNA